VFQSALITAIAIIAGLSAARAIGLGAPLVEAALAGNLSFQTVIHLVEVSAVSGAFVGVLLLVADIFFLPYWPQALIETARMTTTWENFTSSFYGGINEELLLRLFGFSGLVWLLSIIWPPNQVVFWIANICMAILFGVGHLPALKGLTGSISRVMFVRAILLNLPVGLLCGWLFWTYGIEAAMLAHFAVDIVYHVFGTIVLRSKFQQYASRA
jgi:hypothetical protein